MKLLKLLTVAGLSMTLAACCCADKGDKYAYTGGDNVLAEKAGDKVYFGYDSYSLDSKATKTLDKQAAFLKMFPETKATVEGHADERGTRKYNYALGERRANAAKRYLVSQGVASNRIKTVSYGKDRPVDAGHNADAWAKNRRAVTIAVK